jgi:predicted GNAT family acetyltransferase
MTHILDRPVWSALTTRHAVLAEGGDRARRYPPSIVPFAATEEDDPESLEALEALATSGVPMVFLQGPKVVLPPGLAVVFSADAVQMVAERPLDRLEDARIEPLGEAHAEEMLKLATLTKPGPFTLRAQALGHFWGIRQEGRLVAMAGERMRQTGFTELSGLCTHPDVRGHGLGKLMLRFVAGEIAARGDTAYLHAFASNTSAIALYESLGFRPRAPFHAVAAQKG